LGHTSAKFYPLIGGRGWGEAQTTTIGVYNSTLSSMLFDKV
jgi:hypothetical protein